jgi:phosphocarrier protein
MIRRDIVVMNRLGLHARAAAKLVQLANQFKAQVTLSTNQMCADAKSILGVLTLAAAKDTPLTIETNGPDEQQAMEKIESLIKSGFGEE